MATRIPPKPAGMDMGALSAAGQAQSALLAQQARMAQLMEALAQAAIPVARVVTTANVGAVQGTTIDAARAQMEREARAKKEADDFDSARRLIDREYDYRRQKEEEAKRLREADTKAAAARQAAVSAGDMPLSTTDPFLRRAQQDANSARQARAESGRVDAARRGIDPEYARQAATQDTRQAVGRAQSFTSAAQMAGVPGGAAAGNILQGAQMGATVGGPWGAAVGAAVAGAHELGKAVAQAAQEAGKFGVAVVKMDAEGTARQLLSFAAKVPIAGEAISAMGTAALDVSNALSEEARRLSQYNAGLASAVAEIDVRRLERDMQRADQNAPQLIAALERREDLDRRVIALQDKFLPIIAEASIKTVEYVEGVLDRTQFLLQAAVKIGELIEGVLRALNLNLPPAAQQALDLLRGIANNTTRPENFDGADFTRQLRDALRPLEAQAEFREQRGPEDEALRRARREALFPGLQ